MSKCSEEKKDRKKAHDARLPTHTYECKRRSNRPPNLKANIHCKLTRAPMRVTGGACSEYSGVAQLIEGTAL